ncbi:hypothetical protein [Amaricoccus solimangrovi]|uniref:LPS export ABC transporter periplasmic protein LptC n=1 Tax=Amaricoccus solimangrovi TaxID=2589815 RepID=A0A501WWQ6_9RHOB|nr:hypothetical protein [Amaricoccus solimangrovi]TPE52574.1 hypothetical protein FJM51_05190 [Amaricoccus solimangrovi]
MAAPHEHVPDFRSRLVAILKLGLPLVALGMLGALFLIQTDDGLPGGGITFTEGDMEALGEGLSVTNPILTGTSQGDDRFRFTADRVVPDAAPPTRADMTEVAGEINLVGGPRIDLSAPSAALDLETQRIALGGPVLIDTSDGYHMRAATMDVDLAQGVLEAGQSVETDGPLGTITSGTLRIEPSDPKTPDARLISFGNGVRLIYLPTAAPK